MSLLVLDSEVIAVITNPSSDGCVCQYPSKLNNLSKCYVMQAQNWVKSMANKGVPENGGRFLLPKCE